MEAVKTNVMGTDNVLTAAIENKVKCVICLSTDKADFIISGIDEKSLLQAVDTAVDLCKDGQHGIPVPDYVDENVSTKVVKIIQSYVGIVNKMVWRKKI